MATFTAKDAIRIPTATYRLQLNKDFNFRQADRITSYLKRLGISDCYSSPILRARRGSTHCYDVTDHEQINPELGSWNEFNRWVEILHSYGMGLLLDFVPNHMAISDENLLIMDVLEYGPFSKYSHFFDINWNPPNIADLRNRLILPILGTDIHEVFRNRHISLRFSKVEFWLQVYSSKFPLTPKSYTSILNRTRRKLTLAGFTEKEILSKLDKIIGDAAKLPDALYSRREVRYPFSVARMMRIDLGRLCLANSEIEKAISQVLDEFQNNLKEGRYKEIVNLLREQFYKLEFWRNAINKVNYRRFVTINDLIAICEEKPSVFKEAHEFILNLVASQKVNGLRVDHIDGLYNPSDYLASLQKSCQRRHLISKRANMENKQRSYTRNYQNTFYIIVEKILGEGEKIPRSWRVQGTTGYEFLCDLKGLFIDHRNSSKFDRIYSNFIHPQNTTYERIVASSRRTIIDSSMKSELSNLSNLLADIIKSLPHINHPSEKEMRVAIKEVVVCFPVYRTYTSSRVSVADRHYVEQSTKSAIFHLRKKNSNGRYHRIIDDIRRILLLDFPKNISRSQRIKWRLFVMRFQQLTAPVAAKGIEDTAFYVYNKLISLNEVGGNPEDFGISVKEFHQRNLKRLAGYPHSLLTSSTHDTKRSEDVRARINVLSEIPSQWNDAVLSWSGFNQDKKSVVKGELSPSKNDEYMLYQTLIGVWPLGRMNSSQKEELIQRISSYTKKAVREAKVKTSWTDPNLEYEGALDTFIKSILDTASIKEDRQFISSFQGFQEQISYHGMLNSLSQLLMKLTCPGIPDIYQGNEIWDFSLVDPDNRRPVDFVLRSKMLSSLERLVLSSKTKMDMLTRDLMSKMGNGLIKMYVLQQGLKFRSQHEALFKKGSYTALRVTGPKSENVCAFMRKTKDDECIVVVPRLFVSLLSGIKYHKAKHMWKDTCLILPRKIASTSATSYSNIFTGKKVVGVENQEGYPTIRLSDVLEGFPVALLAS